MSIQLSSSQCSQAVTTAEKRPGFISRILQRRLAGFTHGQIVFKLPDGASVRHIGRFDGPQAEIRVYRLGALTKLVLEGDLGFAAAYIDGSWSTDDLGAVLDFGMANERSMTQSLYGSRILHGLNRLQHSVRKNSLRGSKRNIAAHYDLGNAFYEQWLDPDMHYSSGIYRRANDSLEQAQTAKLDKIVSLLDLQGGEKILEIGCGWGAVAERLIAEENCSVTGLTLSQEQAIYTRERLASKGLNDKATIELRDYRDVDAQYDRIVSIEMIEAVGQQYWPVYFETLRKSLKPGGSALLQVISIAEDYFDIYCKRPDYIQKYIFPGGMLPTKSLLHEYSNNAGLKIIAEKCFGDSYARTLSDWQDRFFKQWDTIEALGFDTRFRRMWEYYLTYCKTGFKHGAIDVGLYKLVKA